MFEFFKSDNIIQFSPPRTGSTLLYNVLKEVFLDRNIIKQHKLTSVQKSILCQNYIICSIRNPLDSIASRLQVKECNKEDITDTLIEEYIEYYKQESINDLMYLIKKESKKILILKYEDFFNDFEYLFSQLESLFNIKIEEDIKKTIVEKNSIDNVKKIADKLEKFSQYNKENLIHGKHIGENKGKNGHYLTLLTNNQILKVYESFKDIFELYDYKYELND